MTDPRRPFVPARANRAEDGECRAVVKIGGVALRIVCALAARRHDR